MTFADLIPDLAPDAERRTFAALWSEWRLGRARHHPTQDPVASAERIVARHAEQWEPVISAFLLSEPVRGYRRRRYLPNGGFVEEGRHSTG